MIAPITENKVTPYHSGDKVWEGIWNQTHLVEFNFYLERLHHVNIPNDIETVHSRLRLSEVVCSTRSVIRILAWCVHLVNMTEDLKLLWDIQPTSRDGKLIIPAIVSFFQDYQERLLNMFDSPNSPN